MTKPQTGRIQRDDGKVLRSNGVWYTPKKKHRGQRKYDPGAGNDATKTTNISTGNWKAFRIFCERYSPTSNYNIRYNLNDYQSVIKTLNEFYINYALQTGDLIILPNGLGKFGVRKFKRALKIKADGRPNLAVDWGNYTKTGNITYHTNEHTDGNSFRWVWIKNGSRLINPSDNNRVVNSTMYRFKAVEKAKKLLKEHIANGGDWNKFHYGTDRIKEHFILKRLGRERYGNCG